MGAYGVHELIHRWEQGKLTMGQAVGQNLLLLLEMERRMQELERQ